MYHPIFITLLTLSLLTLSLLTLTLLTSCFDTSTPKKPKSSLTYLGPPSSTIAVQPTLETSSPLLPAPIIQFRCNEVQGSVLVNSGSLGGVATINGDARFDGKGALVFPQGHTATVDTLDLPGVMRNTPLSFCAWFKPALRGDSRSGIQGVGSYPPNAISNDIPTRGGYGIAINVWTDHGGGNLLTVNWHQIPDVTIKADHWYHIAAVNNQGGAIVYVNGVESGKVPQIFTDQDTTVLRLGRHNDDSNYGTRRYWYGSIDDLRFYNQELTATQIKEIFLNGPQ